MGFVVERGRGMQTEPCTGELFSQIISSQRVKNDINRIRSLNAAAKKSREAGLEDQAKAQESEAAKTKSQLPGFCFQANEFDITNWTDSKGVNHGDGRWRKQKAARLNGLFMIDIDHVPNPREIIDRAIKVSDEGLKNLMLAFITPSGEGCKMVYQAVVANGNLYANQKKQAEILGIKIDDVCKDASRLSFTAKEEDFIFVNPEIFEFYNQAYADKYDKEYNESIQSPSFSKEKPVPLIDFVDAGQGDNAPTGLSEEEIKAWRYEDLTIPQIIDLYLGGKAPIKTTRHDTLLELVRDLRHVCNKNEQIIRYYVLQLDWVKDLQAENDPVEQTISDAMGYRYYPKMPKKLEAIFSKHTASSEEVQKEASELRKQFQDWGRQIKDYFKSYPCLKECCAELNPVSFPAALFVGGALFGTLATRTWYYFYHRPNKKRRLNYGIYIIDDPAKGKSFAGDLYAVIMDPIAMSDKLGNDAVNDYKKQKKMRSDSTKEQKKDALVIPDFPIRLHGTRTANGVFIEHMVNCKEEVNGEMMQLHLFTFDSELDSATAASKGGQWIDKSIFELKAFHNEIDDQQYKNVDSVSGPFEVYWNFLYTGTPLSLSRKVTERNFGSGLYGRLACIPLCGEDYKMMEWQNSNKQAVENEKILKEWAYKMDKVSGELPLKPLVKVTWDWCNEQMTIAEIEKDKRIPLLCKRVPYYGINIAAPFVLMRHWDEWELTRSFVVDKTDEDFVKLILDIQFYCQNYYFGKYAEMYLDDQMRDLNQRMTRAKRENLSKIFNELPKEFATEDLEAKGFARTRVHVITTRWQSQGLIKSKGKRTGIFMKI